MRVRRLSFPRVKRGLLEAKPGQISHPALPDLASVTSGPLFFAGAATTLPDFSLLPVGGSARRGHNNGGPQGPLCHWLMAAETSPGWQVGAPATSPYARYRWKEKPKSESSGPRRWEMPEVLAAPVEAPPQSCQIAPFFTATDNVPENPRPSFSSSKRMVRFAPTPEKERERELVY
jgi:hypothetical protein